MKIGIVCYPTFGGSGVLATELGKALSEKGHEVHFIAYRQPVRLDLLSENLFYHEVHISQYPLFEYPPYESALSSKMVDVVRNHHLDLIHVHYAIPHASAAFMAKQILKTYNIDIPILTTLHGTDITLVGKDFTYQPVVEFSINQSDAVSTVSESLKKDTLANFNIQKEVTVIHNFVDLKRFSRNPKESFRKMIAPNGEKILVHTSNFRAVKRTEDVVHIFKQIAEKIPAKLLMVGDGPERLACEQLCRRLQTCSNTRFLGKQDALEEILSIADLFIMPSAAESFGLAALEAMACKVPVVSSNVGGIPELNIHGETGFLSQSGDIDEMANYALEILKDDVTLCKFKERAYLRAQQFDLVKILPQYEALYTKVLAKKR